MIVYRISKKAFIQDLSGIGAGLYGGRWNPKGVNICYTSGSIALAYLEFFIHNYHILSSAEVCLAKIEVGNSENLQEVSIQDLPLHWNSKHQLHRETQKIGADFVTNAKDYILRTPSAIVPGEYNYLLNPLHPDHANTSVLAILDPLEYDERLVELVR